MVKRPFLNVAFLLTGAITIILFTIIETDMELFAIEPVETDMESVVREHHIKPTVITNKKIEPTFIGNKLTIYLTFDDGPNNNTNKILSILKKENIKATFFILEPNLKNHQKTIQRMIADGHALGCHGVTHQLKSFYKTDTAPLKEMDQCRDSILNAFEVKTNLVRTPYGSVPHLSLKQKSLLENEGYELWDWNVDSYDWKTKSSKQLINHTIEQAEALLAIGESPVILFHDIDVTVNSLEKIISRLKKHRVEFATISDHYTPVQFRVEK